MMARSKLVWAATSVAAVALLAVAVVFATSAPSATPSEQPPADTVDVAFEYLDGSGGNLADFVGTPVVVNFWASWCPACVAEMPDFEEVHQEFGDEVVFLGLKMQETNPVAAQDLIEQTGVTYLLGRDPDGSIFTEFGGIAMPTTVFIDARGEVATTHAGAIFARDLEDLIRRELLES